MTQKNESESPVKMFFASKFGDKKEVPLKEQEWWRSNESFNVSIR